MTTANAPASPNTVPAPAGPRPRKRRPIEIPTPLLAGGATALTALIVLGAIGRAVRGAPLLPAVHNPWLVLHLATVIPAVPLGAWLLARRKGDALHRAFGRVWAVLMLVTALDSFALHGITGGLSPIHALSLLTLVTVTVAVRQAMRGDVAAHRRTISRMVAGLVVAGAFTFVPGRLMFAWLVG